jgi:hypothetical protein
MVGSLAGVQLTHLVSPGVLMLIFAGVMTLVGGRMLARRGDDAIEPLPNCRSLRCARAGLGVGLLTGFIGVGGGFLLVPAMILFARLPMAVAAGTSLAVTAANSLAGWLGHLGHERFARGMTGAFLLAALAGMASGARLGGRISPVTMRRSFGWFVLTVAAFVLMNNRSTGRKQFNSTLKGKLNMQLKRYYVEDLAHASCLIGAGGEAAVVDPKRDVARRGRLPRRCRTHGSGNHRRAQHASACRIRQRLSRLS